MARYKMTRKITDPESCSPPLAGNKKTGFHFNACRNFALNIQRKQRAYKIKFQKKVISYEIAAFKKTIT